MHLQPYMLIYVQRSDLTDLHLELTQRHVHGGMENTI